MVVGTKSKKSRKSSTGEESEGPRFSKKDGIILGSTQRVGRSETCVPGSLSGIPLKTSF